MTNGRRPDESGETNSNTVLYQRHRSLPICLVGFVLRMHLHQPHRGGMRWGGGGGMRWSGGGGGGGGGEVKSMRLVVPRRDPSRPCVECACVINKATAHARHPRGARAAG